MRAALPHVFLAMVTVLLVGALAAVFGDTLVFPLSPYVATEATMGIVQRIFYIHVPAAATAFLAFFVTFVASTGYLITRRLAWDNVAQASVEVGVLFCTGVLVTGPLWARPVWGVWWPWEPRLTTTLILWLLYVAYLLLRSYVDNREQKARFCAVLGIVAFLDVPIVYKSVEWWRGVHPKVFGKGGGGIEPSMQYALLVVMAAFFLLYGILVAHRVSLGRMEDEIDELRAATGG